MPGHQIPGSQDQGVPVDGVALLSETMIHVANRLLPKEFEVDFQEMVAPSMGETQPERKRRSLLPNKKNDHTIMLRQF